MKTPKNPPSKIVSAVMASSGSISPGGMARAMLIQDAMTEAIKQAQAEGVTDPAEIKRRMLEARERVKREAV